MSHVHTLTLQNAAVVRVDENEAVPGLTGLHVLDCFIDVVHVVLLHPRLDALRHGQVKHLLNLARGSDGRTGDRRPRPDQGAGRNADGVRDDAHDDDRAHGAQEAHVVGDWQLLWVCR